MATGAWGRAASSSKAGWGPRFFRPCACSCTGKKSRTTIEDKKYICQKKGGSREGAKTKETLQNKMEKREAGQGDDHLAMHVEKKA